MIKRIFYNLSTWEDGILELLGKLLILVTLFIAVFISRDRIDGNITGDIFGLENFLTAIFILIFGLIIFLSFYGFIIDRMKHSEQTVLKKLISKLKEAFPLIYTIIMFLTGFTLYLIIAFSSLAFFQLSLSSVLSLSALNPIDPSKIIMIVILGIFIYDIVFGIIAIGFRNFIQSFNIN